MTQEATGAALVERVARAMFLDGVANVEVAISGDVWSSLSAGSRKVWLSQARAAIREIAEAMREPSDGMIHDGAAASDHPSVFMGGPSHNGRRKADRIYRAMLAASPLSDPRA